MKESTRFAGVLLVCGTLFVSAVRHLLQPYQFVHALAGYELLPRPVLLLFGLLLPGLMMFLAMAVLTRAFARPALATCVALFSSFAAVQVTALWRGLDVDCGCFGYSESVIGLPTLSVPIALAAVAAAALWLSPPAGEAQSGLGIV